MPQPEQAPELKLAVANGLRDAARRHQEAERKLTLPGNDRRIEAAEEYVKARGALADAIGDYERGRPDG